MEPPDTVLLKPPSLSLTARLSADKSLPQAGQRFQFSQVGVSLQTAEKHPLPVTTGSFILLNSPFRFACEPVSAPRVALFLTSTSSVQQVFGPETTQRDLFQGTVKDLVKDVLDGGNSLVFTYGVTNAGKTFTFLGDTFTA